MKNESFKLYQNKLNSVKAKVEVLSKIIKVEDLERDLEKLASDVESRESDKKAVNYLDFIPTINAIDKKIEKFYIPAHSLVNKAIELDKKLDNVDEFSLKDITLETKKLIKEINTVYKRHLKLNNYEINGDIFSAIVHSSNVIYHAVLNEAALGKSNIFDMVVSNGGIVKTHMECELQSDSEKISKETFDKIMKGKPDKKTRKLDKESEKIINRYYPIQRRDYNYFDKDLVNEIVSMELKDKQEAYNERKHTATMELLNHFDNIKKETSAVERLKIERKSSLKDVKGSLRIARLKLASYILIPIMLLAGTTYGGSELIRAHKVTTRTHEITNEDHVSEDIVDYNTNNISKINIRIVGAWEENKYGPGYVRYNEEYEFTSDGDISDINFQDVMDMAKYLRGFTETNVDLKYETADELTEEENIQRTIITETIIDNNDSRGSILGGAIGLGVGALIDLLYFILMIRNDVFSDNYSDIVDYKDRLRGIVERKVIRKKYQAIGNKKVLLKDEYKLATERYNISKEPENVEIEKVRQYVRG